MNVLMYQHNMNKKNGGVTFALFNRGKTLLENDENNHNIHIYTYGYLTEPQIESEKIQITNFFDYMNDETGMGIENINYISDLNNAFQDKKNPNAYRVFDNGRYVQYNVYENEILKEIDFFDEDYTRKAKAFFNDGKITRYVNMTKQNNPISSRYIKNGKCYLTTKMYGWRETDTFDHIRKKELTFDETQFYYLKKYIIENEINVIFVDKRDHVNTFLRIKRELPEIKLYFFLHNNHYDDIKTKEKHHSSLDDLKNNIEMFEKIIVLTPSQTEALITEWGCEDKFVTINNVIEYKKYPNVMPDRQKYILIGRFENQKNIFDAIKVIKIVQEKYPDVSLDIFGYGSHEQRLIEEIGDNDKIKINGFVNNAQKKIAEYSGFVLTSNFEGQPLVLLEAFDSSTPIFSYDCDFGPRDIVTNYDNGIITENNTPECMAEYIIKYIDGEINFKFSQTVEEKFNKKDYVEKVNNLLIEGE